MRVVHINLYDRHGGAARISWTLMEDMTEMGHETIIFAHRKTSQDSRVIPIPFLQTKWQKKLLTQQSQQGLFDLYSAALLKVLTHPFFEQADIVHLHCINGQYFSFLLLPYLASKPMVWTLHDSLAFTADCLFTDSCQGWKNDWCMSCPLESEKNSGLQREIVQHLKSLLYKVSNFTVVCPSAWLTQQAKESILQEKDIRLIYNGVAVDIFKPGSKEELRLKLELPPDKKIILFVAHGGLSNESKGGKFLYEALLALYKQYPDIMLLTVGGYHESVLGESPIVHMDIPFIDNQQHLAEYYAAADLYVSPTLTEVFGLTICEAMASGTPVVAFSVGGIPEVVIHKENGYLVEPENVEELILGISYFLDNEERRQQAGKAARLRVVQQFNSKVMVTNYLTLYEELLKNKQFPETELLSLSPNEINRIVEKNESKGWDFVWGNFREIYTAFSEEQSLDRMLFVDQFCTYCLKAMNSNIQSHVLWEVISQWQLYRPMPERYSDLIPKQREVLFDFIQTLRKSLYEYFEIISKDQSVQLEEQQRNKLYLLWQQVFLNEFLPLEPQTHDPISYHEFNNSLKNKRMIAADFINLMGITMYYPMEAEQFDINLPEMWQDPTIPEYCKVILSFWVMHVPYYNLEEKHRQKILKYAADLFTLKMSGNSFIPLVNESTKALWRISYVGGNNLEVLSSFGDFIASHMRQFFLNRVPQATAKQKKKAKKIRIGYISRLFYGQAVSYYMVNRVIHHNKDKFEVFTFALGNNYDEITGIFEKNSNRFKHFKNIDTIEDVYRTVDDIINSQLDILIYTDIGMDPLTYMLAGIRLAPIQCVLVGHGTTTGLPTIDYYISGDFEPADAACHYREKLIKLPNLGAAQFPPPFAESVPVTRKDWKIPEDAVVFVSCANGIKHGPSRDALLVEILKRIPNSCMLLKPCHLTNLDYRLGERIMTAAQKAGVANRLFIVPPLGRIDALLAISDIQLDTYPYGGWTTTMEALYMGLPTITQEGDMARSRWGAYMLRALGIQEGIACNEAEYVDWAVQLANNKELRKQIKEKILSQVKSVLFNGAAAQIPYERALINIFNGKQKRKDT